MDAEAFIEQYSDNEVYLEHFGKKGMKWGIRNKALKKAEKGDWKTRSVGQKTGLVVGGYVGMAAGQVAASAIISKLKMSASPMTYKKLAVMAGINMGSQIAGAVVGARLTRNVLQKYGKKPIRQLEKSYKKTQKQELKSFAKSEKIKAKASR